jgi:hypothetical protein
MSGISVVFGGKKSTLPRLEFIAVAALRCGAIISGPRLIFMAWILSRTAKFTNAMALKYSSVIRLTGHSGENFAQRELDIVIDDGGHEYEQQVVSLEELLPHLRPGGVYLCEDVHGAFNLFSSYVGGLAHKLNEMANVRGNLDDPDRRLVSDTTMFQKRTNSIHLYPFVVVVEKNRADVSELVAPKHGTQWEPFLK